LLAALPIILTGMRGFTVALPPSSAARRSPRWRASAIASHLAEGMEMAQMFAYIVFVVMIALILNTAVSTLGARQARR
jgi:hypothetical protein